MDLEKQIEKQNQIIRAIRERMVQLENPENENPQLWLEEKAGYIYLHYIIDNSRRNYELRLGGIYKYVEERLHSGEMQCICNYVDEYIFLVLKEQIRTVF